jgi:hypothetical protein
MNEKCPTFTCPVCNNRLKWETVVLDEFFDEILNKLPLELDSIEIQPDGSWDMPVIATHVETKSSTPTIEILIDDDDDEDVPLKKMHSHIPAKMLKTVTSSSFSNVIDLTLSDDDEEVTMSAETTNQVNVSSDALQKAIDDAMVALLEAPEIPEIQPPAASESANLETSLNISEEMAMPPALEMTQSETGGQRVPPAEDEAPQEVSLELTQQEIEQLFNNGDMDSYISDIFPASSNYEHEQDSSQFPPTKRIRF